MLTCIAIAIAAFVVGILVGAAIAFDKAFTAGKSFGFQLGRMGISASDAADIEPRVRSFM